WRIAAHRFASNFSTMDQFPATASSSPRPRFSCASACPFLCVAAGGLNVDALEIIHVGEGVVGRQRDRAIDATHSDANAGEGDIDRLRLVGARLEFEFDRRWI